MFVHVKNAVKVRDLKIYNFVVENQQFIEDLLFKVSGYHNAGCTPEKYEKFHPLNYWSQSLTALGNLRLLNQGVLRYKENLVLNTDGSYGLYPDSRGMLLDFLKKLWIGWTCSLEIFSELYFNSNYKVEALDYKLVSFLLSLIPVIEEIINILYSWYDEIPQEAPFPYIKGLFDYTIINEEPAYIHNPERIKFINYPRAFWIDVVIHSVYLSEDYIAALDAGLRQKIEYKFRIKDLDPRAAIDFVFKEVFLDVDMKTLHFLGSNPPADFEAMRGRSLFTNRKK